MVEGLHIVVEGLHTTVVERLDMVEGLHMVVEWIHMVERLHIVVEWMHTVIEWMHTVVVEHLTSIATFSLLFLVVLIFLLTFLYQLLCDWFRSHLGVSSTSSVDRFVFSI